MKNIKLWAIPVLVLLIIIFCTCFSHAYSKCDGLYLHERRYFKGIKEQIEEIKFDYVKSIRVTKENASFYYTGKLYSYDLKNHFVILNNGNEKKLFLFSDDFSFVLDCEKKTEKYIYKSYLDNSITLSYIKGTCNLLFQSVPKKYEGLVSDIVYIENRKAIEIDINNIRLIYFSNVNINKGDKLLFIPDAYDLVEVSKK